MDGSSDLLRTFRTAAAPGSTDEGRRRWFEAARDIALAWEALWIVSDPDDAFAAGARPWTADAAAGHDLRRAIRRLTEDEIIDPETTLIDCASLHDPQAPYRSRAVIPRQPLLCRDGINGRWIAGRQGDARSVERDLPPLVAVTLKTPFGPVTALLAARRKGLLSTIGKLLRLCAHGVTDDGRDVPDRRGIRFLYRNTEDMVIGAKHLSRLFGRPLQRKVRLTAADGEWNAHAASDLLLIKDMATFGWRQLYEIQNMLATQYADLRFSHGPENADLYHLRQHVSRGETATGDGLFWHLFPREIYGIDWADRGVIRRMEEHVLASIS